MLCINKTNKHVRPIAIMRKSKSIEFGALRIFASVANAETLTQAADRIGITQSAVSQAIKQLEEQTEVELIMRRSRPIRLTPGGEVLYNYAQKVLSDTSRVMNDVRLASKGNLSNLHVGMIDSFADALGLQFINKINPLATKITLQTGLHTSLSNALRSRDIDILITSDRIHHEPGLTSHALIRDPFLVIAPKGTINANDESKVLIRHLANTTPFIHYLPSSRIGKQTDLIARRLGIQLNTKYEMDSTQTLLRFVRAGNGWAIISALCLVRYPELLETVDVINLDNGSNARFITQVSRNKELGTMPKECAEIIRTLFNSHLSPILEQIAPWLVEQAYTIKKLPAI